MELALARAAAGGEREVEGGVADGMSGTTAIDMYVGVKKARRGKMNCIY